MRAIYANNDRQHNRMVQDKLRSFHRALLYSYQAAWIKKDAENADWCRALINPDKIKFDYDEKIVSIDFKHKFQPGDTFEWPKGSNIHWIILKQELTELAYFRGNIRRCQALEVEDPDTGEKLKLWAAIRGPVETKINSIQKAGIVADVPNLSLQIYLPKTEKTQALFERYCRFTFAGRTWMVQAPDAISTPGILEIAAEEDYNCQHSDLIEEVQDPNEIPESETSPQIIGETFIKPLQTATYSANVIVPGYSWSIALPSDKKEVKDVLQWTVNDKTSIAVTWTAMVSGEFTLYYGPLEKTIVVESLF